MSSFKHSFWKGTFSAILLTAALVSSPGAGAQEIKISHQWPETEDEFRHEVANKIKTDLAAKGLRAEVYGNQRLLRGREQWQGLKDGTVDIALIPLSDAVPNIREFQYFSMPGMSKNLEHSLKLYDTPAVRKFAEQIRQTERVVIAGHMAQSTAAGAARNCIATPKDLEGLSLRGSGGQAANALIEEAGGTPVPISQPEIANAMRSGALDAFMTSAGSLNSGRYFGIVRCVTLPGEGTLGTVSSSIVVSQRLLDRLGNQQQVVLDAIKEAVAFGLQRSVKMDTEAIATYKDGGVTVKQLTAAEGEEWRKLAERSVMREFAKISPIAAEMIKDALTTN
jgi:TRAP-type C4-dicarboxylate transport system substrate-binding protein